MTVQLVFCVVRDQSDIVHSENSCVLVFVRDQSEILRCAFVPEYSDILFCAVINETFINYIRELCCVFVNI